MARVGLVAIVRRLVGENHEEPHVEALIVDRAREFRAALADVEMNHSFMPGQEAPAGGHGGGAPFRGGVMQGEEDGVGEHGARILGRAASTRRVGQPQMARSPIHLMTSASPSAQSIRPAVAELAQRYRDGQLAYSDFLRLLPRGADRQDEAVAGLVDEVVTGAQSGGAEREEHLRRIAEWIARLEGAPA
jgi:hypothetical protein